MDKEADGLLIVLGLDITRTEEGSLVAERGSD
jgi:hypothetical protein